MGYPLFPLVRNVACLNAESEVWLGIPTPCKVSYKF